MVALLIAVMAALAGMSAAFGQAVAWGVLLPRILIGTILLTAGLILRLVGRLPGLAALLVALGFYQCFTLLGVSFVYMRFPLEVAPIDPIIERLDAYLGYSWPRAALALAQHPWLSSALFYIYLSSLWQLALLVFWLAATRREAMLHRYILTGALTFILAIAIWWMAPSLGPATLHDLDPEVANRLGLVVSKAYAAELLRLAAEGSEAIGGQNFIGVVAFPSYHIVMSLLILWFARGTLLFVPATLVGIAMVPATLVHGGHHLLDLVGGGLVFLVAVVLTGRVVPAPSAVALGRAHGPFLHPATG